MNAQNKKIGLLSAIIIQTNAMIGAGVVVIPALLAQTTGPLGLLAYVLCILIILCMTFSLGELSLLHGGNAWCYRFPALLGKPLLGTLGSLCYVSGVLIAMGFVAKQAGIWLHESIPFLQANLLCFLTVLLLTLFVLAGKNISSFWQYVYSGIILLGIVVTTVICFEHFDEKLFFQKVEANSCSIFVIAPMLLFSFLGFESISSLYAIVKNPRRNVFIGGLIGVVCVAILYMTFSTSVVGSINSSYFVGHENLSLAAILTRAFPKYKLITQLLYFGGLFAIIGTLHSMIWSVSVLIGDLIKKSSGGAMGSILIEKTNFPVIFSALCILVSGFFLMSKTIMNASVTLIALSYSLSILALFKEKKHHYLNRLICLGGLLGGALMVLFSLYSLINDLF